jgi:hypothetical protein
LEENKKKDARGLRKKRKKAPLHSPLKLHEMSAAPFFFLRGVARGVPFAFLCVNGLRALSLTGH